MANELQVRLSLTYRSGSDQMTIPDALLQQTVAAAARVQGVQDIGTVEEALNLGDVSSDGGAFYARNLDDTNSVEIGRTGSMVVKLGPGQACFLAGVSTRNLYAIATGAACKLSYALFSP